MSLDFDNSLSIVAFDTPIRSAICLLVILGFTFIRLIILSRIEDFEHHFWPHIGPHFEHQGHYWIQTIQSNHEIALADIDLRLMFCALISEKIISHLNNTNKSSIFQCPLIVLVLSITNNYPFFLQCRKYASNRGNRYSQL